MKQTKVIHLFAILAILLIPVMFVRPEEKLTLTLFLFKSVMSVTMILLFYINFLWLVPRMIATGKRWRFVCINLVLVIVGAVIVMQMRGYEFRYIDMMNGIRERPHGELPLLFQFLIVFRDGLNLVLSVLVAYSMRMTQHAHRQNKLRQEAEVAKREAELRGLRFQISPHFLLNTLNNIYALTAISAERAQVAIMQLSHLLRHMLYESQEKEVELRQEVDFIRSYVDLMRLRLPRNVSVSMDISVADDDSVKVAPLLFISLVENAFKHGVSASQPSVISISISSTACGDGMPSDCRGRMIVCHVSNSNFPKTDKDRSGHGIGLEQVRQRLDAAYSGRYSWTCGVDDGDGLYHSEIVILPSDLR